MTAAPNTHADTDLLARALYDELHRIAHRERLRVGAPQTLRTTALIHEAYLKLHHHASWSDKDHFLRTAANAMRQVLVDAARARLTDKRGKGEGSLPLEAADEVAATPGDAELVQVGDALDSLAQLDLRLAQIVECRFFAGYSEIETAQVLGLSERTVRRDWLKAKAWLYREVTNS